MNNGITSPMAHFYKVWDVAEHDQTILDRHGIVDFRSLMGHRDTIVAHALDDDLEESTKYGLAWLVGYLVSRRRKGDYTDGNEMLRALTKEAVIKDSLPAYDNGSSGVVNRAGGRAGVQSGGKSVERPNEPNEVSKLPPQGFHPIQDDKLDNDVDDNQVQVEDASDDDFRLYNDGGKERRFDRGACFKYEKGEEEFIVGIKSFSKTSQVHANCVQIEPLTETFLGDGADDIDVWATPLCPGKHVQVRKKLPPLPLSDLGDLVPKMSIPKLIYEPQIEFKQAFGYVVDDQEHESVRLGARDFERFPVNVVELFCAAGGMHEGYKNADFTTITAVDKCAAAIESFRKNNPNTPAKEALVEDVLKEWTPQENVHLLHTSSPCCGFSRINCGSKNDDANNELSYTFFHGIKKYRPLYGVFENVEGIWSVKGMPI